MEGCITTKCKIGLSFGIIFLFVLSAVSPISFGYSVNISYDIEQCSILESNGYIQNLIDEASDGDTIYIPSGTYYENIVIDKSISLIGEDKDTTVIDGRGRGNVVHISANWVNITGFKICDT